jgi:hypothetical protein
MVGRWAKIKDNCSMEIEHYRQIIQDLILERLQKQCSPEEVETQAVLDTERDHYLLLHTGWRGNSRTHGCSIHLDIKDGKIWIQHDCSKALPWNIIFKALPYVCFTSGRT